MTLRLLIRGLAIWAFITLSIQPSSSAGPVDTDSSVYRTVSEYQLSNGLSVILQPDNTLPLAAIEIRVKTGSATEVPIGSGISHLLEHMLFKGTSNRSSDQIELNVKSWGGTINAFTSYDISGYKLSLRSEFLSQGIELLSDIYSNALFDAGEIEKEKQVILNEISRREDDPVTRLVMSMYENTFPDHPYGFSIAGYPDVLVTLSRDDLLSYYRSRYVPNNTVISIVGDFDTEECLKWVKESFGGYPRIPLFIPRAEPQEIVSGNREVTIDSPLSQVYEGFAFRGPSISDRDMYVLDVIAAALFSGDSSILNTLLVKDLGAAYTVSGFNSSLVVSGVFGIFFVTDEDKADRAAEAVYSSLKDLREKGLSDDVLNRVVNSNLSSFFSELETIQGRAGDMATSFIYTRDYAFSLKYLERMRTITNDDIKRVANKYLKEDYCVRVNMMPVNLDIDENRRDQGASIDTDMFTLENGLRVVISVQKDSPFISLRALYRGGLLSENRDNNGISAMTAQVMIRGTESRKDDRTIGEMESLGGDISPFSGYNSFGFSVDALARDSGTALDIFEDVVLHPAFRKDMVDLQKRLMTGQIKRDRDDIFRSGFDLLKSTLYSGSHPYGMKMSGTEESISSITPGDIKAYYRDAMVPSQMVIGVSGNIDRDEIEKRFAKTLGRISPGKPGSPPDFSEVFSGRKEASEEKETFQSLIIMGFPGTTIDSPDRYKLDLLSSILSGYNGRLYFNLRDKLGAGYSMGASNQPAFDPGYFALYVSTAREKIPEIREMLIKEIDKVKQKITDSEIEMAKASLITGHLNQEQTSRGMNFTMSFDELYGLGYDEFRKFPSIIESITAEDLYAAAKKYLSEDKMVEVIIEGVDEL